jgi:hypothetical protein
LAYAKTTGERAKKRIPAAAGTDQALPGCALRRQQGRKRGGGGGSGGELMFPPVASRGRRERERENLSIYYKLSFLNAGFISRKYMPKATKYLTM